MQTTNCPHCSSGNIIKKGIRKGKLTDRQMYLCKECSTKFTDKQHIPNQTYPAKIILETVSLYNLGYPLTKIQKLMQNKTSLHIPTSTLHYWTQRFDFKGKRVKNYKDKTIIQKIFHHHNINYTLKYHKYKLNRTKFKELRDYILSLDSWISKYFKHNLRCSKINLHIKPQKITQSKNIATKLTKLVLTISKSNKSRHNLIEKYLLINDNATIAVEVPVFYFDKRLGKINGHIDILQLKNNLIYILDYKPEANKQNIQKVTSQLTIYALALSFRTKIPLRKFRCAWFDENNYYEFKPAKTYQINDL